MSFSLVFRHHKELPSTQLSPVKKRVKESSPPLGLMESAQPGPPPAPPTAEEAMLQLAGWAGAADPLDPAHSRNGTRAATTGRRPFIVIRDTPSPVSVITISSDSEDEGDGLRQGGHRHHRRHEAHLTDRWAGAKPRNTDHRQHSRSCSLSSSLNLNLNENVHNCLIYRADKYVPCFD